MVQIDSDNEGEKQAADPSNAADDASKRNGSASLQKRRHYRQRNTQSSGECRNYYTMLLQHL